MKQSILVIASAICLLLPQKTAAQGTVYLSNLGEPSAGSAVIASDFWIAQDFQTGTNSRGYVLNSVQLLMGAATGTPSGFSVSIFNSLNGRPGFSLGQLNGLEPGANGVYTYASSGIQLSPFMFYYAVLTAATPAANGAYAWNLVTDRTFDSNDGWIMDHIYFTSSDGSSWPGFGRDHFFQMAISGTAVPEPGSCLLILLGLAGICLRRRLTAAKQAEATKHAPRSAKT